MPITKGSRITRKPLVLKVLKGSHNPSRDPLRPTPAALVGYPPMPSYLNRWEREAWEMFRAVLEPVHAEGVHLVTRSDFAAVESLVTVYAMKRRLEAAARGVEFGSRDYGRYVKVINALDRRLAMWLSRFGMMPGELGSVAGRGGVTPAARPTAGDDEFAQK